MSLDDKYIVTTYNDQKSFDKALTKARRKFLLGMYRPRKALSYMLFYVTPLIEDGHRQGFVSDEELKDFHKRFADMVRLPQDIKDTVLRKKEKNS